MTQECKSIDGTDVRSCLHSVGSPSKENQVFSRCKMLQQSEKLGKSSLACETPESSQHICGCQHHHHPLHRSASCTSPSSAPPLQPPHPRGKNTSLPSRVRRPDPSSSLLTLHSLADLVFLYTVTESKSRKKKCRRNPGSFMEN